MFLQFFDLYFADRFVNADTNVFRALSVLVDTGILVLYRLYRVAISGHRRVSKLNFKLYGCSLTLYLFVFRFFRPIELLLLSIS